jgi:signal transduction histidine kinase
LIGQDVWQAFPGVEAAEVGRAMRQAADIGQPLTLETPSILTPKMWMEVRIFPSELGVAAFFSNVTARREARQALVDRQRQLSQLASDLLRSQSEERRAIARELHDELGQQLAALRINLQVMRGQDGEGADATRIDDCLAIVTQLIAQVRQRALDLHPAVLDDLGLHAALQWLCERQAQRSGVAVVLNADPELPRLPEPVELACFRIVQEAMANALKYAQAQHIEVTVSLAAAQLVLEVQDDGRGFDPQLRGPSSAGSSLGLTGMRERAQQLGGSFEIDSQPGHGTRLRVTFPLTDLLAGDLARDPSPTEHTP